MKSLLGIALFLSAVVSTVTSDCDYYRCTKPLSTVDLADSMTACPVMRNSVACFEGLVKTCERLSDEGRRIVKVKIEDSRGKVTTACSSADGFVSPTSWYLLTVVSLAVVFGHF